jgi:hypothetical protein
MDNADRLRLQHSPYRPPRCRVGGRLTCAVRGRLWVVGLSNAPVFWQQAGADALPTRPAVGRTQGGACFRWTPGSRARRGDG